MVMVIVIVMVMVMVMVMVITEHKEDVSCNFDEIKKILEQIKLESR